MIPTRYLLEQGHRDIAIMLGPEYHYTAFKRLEGYKKALGSFGIPYRPELILRSDYTEKGSYQCFLESWEKMPIHPTAFLATNYDSTLGCYMAIRKLNLSIPQNISYIGYSPADRTSSTAANTGGTAAVRNRGGGRQVGL